MSHRVVVSAVIGACVLQVIGCARLPSTMERSDNWSGLVTCAEPRPEACTMHFDPVCGEVTEGISKTYSNACVACSDSKVTGYRAGACETAAAEKTRER